MAIFKQKATVFVPLFVHKDTFYKRLSFLIGLVCAYSLFYTLHLEPEFKLNVQKLPNIEFEFITDNLNTNTAYAPKDANKIEKKDNKTPEEPAPAKNPVPTVKPKQLTESTNKKEVTEIKVSAPVEVKSPVEPKTSDIGNTTNATDTQHIETSAPNTVINTGGTFGSGTPPVITSNEGAPMLEIPKILDTDEISDRSVMKDKVEQAAGMSDKPPLPSPDAVDQTVYTDRPGGDVLILKLFINDSGSVIDSKIMVPSKYPLNDISTALASRSAKFKNLVPPLRPGEIRELEVRVPYVVSLPSDTKNDLP